MGGPPLAHSARMATRRWPFNLVSATPYAAPTRPPRRVGPLLALAFFAFYALTCAGTKASEDGGVMYDTAMAIVNRHTLALPPHHHGMPGVNGGFYSKYGIAQSIAEIPLYVVGRALAARTAPPLSEVLALAVTMLTNPLIMALAVWLVFLLCYELWPNVRAAALAAILVGVASPFWPYAKTDFSEPLSAAALTGAALYLVRARRRPGAWTFALSGAFVALALLTKLTAAVALPAIGLYALFVAVAASDGGRLAAARRLLAWGGAVAAGLALTALYNLARYGHIADTGYRGDDVPFRAPLLRGLEGLLVSPGKGLLWFCPLVLVALALWPVLLKRRRAEGLLALGIVAPTLGVFATFPVWWGGVCWGPRYLLPVVPFVLMPLALLLDKLPRAAFWRRAVMTVVALSVLVQVLGVAVHPSRYLSTLPTEVRDAESLWSPAHSPLLGQSWLAAYDAIGVVDRPDQQAMLAAYPWRHPQGVSPGQRLAIANWDYWWWEILGKKGLRRRDQAGIAAALLLALALAAWGLRGLRRPAEDKPYDHRRMAVPV